MTTEVIEWIPVAERLPDDYTQVLIFSDICKTGFGWYVSRDDVWEPVVHVTHWAELPKGPSE